MLQAHYKCFANQNVCLDPAPKTMRDHFILLDDKVKGGKLLAHHFGFPSENKIRP